MNLQKDRVSGKALVNVHQNEILIGDDNDEDDDQAIGSLCSYLHSKAYYEPRKPKQSNSFISPVLDINRYEHHLYLPLKTKHDGWSFSNKYR